MSTVRNHSQASYTDVRGSLGPPSEIPDVCRLAVGLHSDSYIIREHGPVGGGMISMGVWLAVSLTESSSKQSPHLADPH